MSRVAVRRKLTTGSQWDLVAGIDLLDPSHRQALWKYLFKAKPRVIVMAPPCTMFSGWQTLNESRCRDRTLWDKRMKQAHVLANLAADIAL